MNKTTEFFITLAIQLFALIPLWLLYWLLLKKQRINEKLISELNHHVNHLSYHAAIQLVREYDGLEVLTPEQRQSYKNAIKCIKDFEATYDRPAPENN